MIRLKINFKKINFKKVLESQIKFWASRAFLAYLLLLFFGLIFGGFMFYKYGFLIQKTKPELIKKPFQFKENVYQEISEKWKELEIKFQNAELKSYPNLFSPREAVVSTSSEQSLKEETEEERGEKEENAQALLKAKSLFEFYQIKGENLPSLDERGRLWQEKGLGSFEEYTGSSLQNSQLLEVLKSELE